MRESVKLKKGSVVDGRFTIEMPMGESKFTQSFRAKDKNGETLWLELTDVAALPSTFFDDDGRMHKTGIMETLEDDRFVTLKNSGKLLIDNSQFVYHSFEFVSGESLDRKLKREGSVPLYQAILIIIELLEGLDRLHNLQVPVVHNSINPSTIYLDYSKGNERVKISGLDQARTILQNDLDVSSESLSCFHTAPELLNGISTLQSDIFSAGALLYQLVMGIPPWYEESLLKLPFRKLRKSLEVARSAPPIFSDLGSGSIDDHLKLAIVRSLSPDYRERFQSAREFADVLSRRTTLSVDGEQLPVDRIQPRRIPDSERGFGRIAGMAELKKILQDDVISPLSDPELYSKYGVTIPNGLLLYGPPGCGKTYIAENFADEIGYNFIKIHPSDLQSKWINASQENIGELFRSAEENAPTIIFIDEIDAVAPKRSSDLNHMHSAAVNELLARMSNCGEKGIFVIGTTNRPETIDSALLRTGRFDRAVYVPPPDAAARAAMFKLYLNNRPVDLSIDYEFLAELTENFVSSDLKFLVDQGSRRALQNNARIDMEIMCSIIESASPSVTKDEIRRCKEAKEIWEHQRSNEENRAEKIGFIRNSED